MRIPWVSLLDLGANIRSGTDAHLDSKATREVKCLLI